jgi:hypothetical protein
MKTTGLNWITEILEQKSLSILENVYVMRFVFHKTIYLNSETEVKHRLEFSSSAMLGKKVRNAGLTDRRDN